MLVTGVRACGGCGSCEHCQAVRSALHGVVRRVKQLHDQANTAAVHKEHMWQRMKTLAEEEAELTQREVQVDRAARKLAEMAQLAKDAPPVDDFDRPFEGAKPSGKPSLQMFLVTPSSSTWLYNNTLGRLGVF